MEREGRREEEKERYGGKEAFGENLISHDVGGSRIEENGF